MKMTLPGLLLLAGWATATPATAQNPAADTVQLRQNLAYLTTTPLPRNYRHQAVLDSAFYRNRRYHQAGDILARLDMCCLDQAVDALMTTVLAGTY